ncbi:MAG: deoxyribodipyrimidine photolyase, partial [Gammaproteobacteria bacterium]
TVQPDGELEPVDLVKRVDQALYQAKDNGRDAIAVA